MGALECFLLNPGEKSRWSCPAQGRGLEARSSQGKVALSESVSGNRVLGSTGHWPVPSGDSPDGMGRASPTNEDGLLLGATTLVPVGGSPTGTGGSPVLPIFQTRSEPNC